MLDNSFQQFMIPLMKKDLRQKIIDAVVFVGARKGIDNITNSTIAEKCGISNTALYYYFKDKNELIKEAALYVANNLSSYIAKNQKLSNTYEENFKASLYASMVYQLKNKNHSLFYYYIVMSPQQILTPSYGELVKGFCPVMKLIDHGIQTGLIKSTLLNTLVISYFPIFTYVMLVHRQKQYPPEQEIDSFVELLWEAVSVSPEKMVASR